MDSTQFAPVIKRSFNLLISDAINERLKSALNQEKQLEVAEAVKVEDSIAAEPASLIVTTEEELEWFYIFKSMLRQHIDAKGITYRDAQSYFAILLDDNNRKTICRLYLGNGKQCIAILDEARKELKFEIKALDELYQHTEAFFGSDRPIGERQEPMSKLFMLLITITLHANAHRATCTGSKPCKACKSCKYCERCAKDGKTCGTCK